jgi:hypothetical protein
MGGPGIVAGSGENPRPLSTTGWDTRLYWHWIFYNSIAFIALLTAVAVMVWLSVDVLDLAVGNRNLVGALLVATFGALLFGGVLGSLQWLVVRERVLVPRRRWVVANVGPALLGWLLVIMPAVLQAYRAHEDVGVAYMLAASQTLALGPLLGLSQAVVLRGYTPRWAWWIAANLVSWLIVDLVVAVTQRFNPFDFSNGNDSIAGLYLMLVATTPLTGRAILWVLAPSVISGQKAATTS